MVNDSSSDDSENPHRSPYEKLSGTSPTGCGHAKSRLAQVLTLAALAAILAFYGFVQVRCFAPAYMEDDPDGYVMLAKRMAEGKPLAVIETDPFLYHSHVWVENERGEVVPKFAPGYPALMAVFYRFFGDEGMFYVSPLMGALALAGSFCVFRVWMPAFPSLLGVLTLATNNAILFYSGYLLTHIVNLCFITWGMFFLLKWLQTPSLVFSIGAGLSLGYAATVRHTSGLFVLVVALALAVKFLEGEKSQPVPYKPMAALALAYLPFPLLLAAYNWSLFGHPLRTGYALSNEQYAFSFTYMARNFGMLNRGMSSSALPMIFPFGVLGLVFCGGWTDRLVRWMWFLPIYAIYASYYWATENMAYLRFLFDLFPVLTAAAYLLIEQVNVSKLTRYAAMAILCVLAVTSNGDHLLRAARGYVYARKEIAQAARAASQTLPSDAVLFAASPLCYHLGTRQHFRLYNLETFTSEYGEKIFSGYPSRGEPRRQKARTRRFQEFYRQTSDEELVGKEQGLIDHFLKESRTVVFFIQTDQLEFHQAQLGGEYDFLPLKELNLSSWGHWTIFQVTPRGAAPRGDRAPNVSEGL